MSAVRACALLVLMMGLLVGCSVESKGAKVAGVQVDESLTPAEAKRQTQEVEREVIALVPPEYVAEVRQQQTGVFMECSPDRKVAWAGGAFITVAGAPDFLTLLRGIQADFERREGFRTVLRDRGSGRLNLDIIGDGGGLWIIGPYDHETKLFMSSWSRCFPLPEEIWIRAEY